MTVHALRARELAAALVADLAAEQPRALTFRGLDLAGAIEQQFFFALRDGRRPTVRGPRGLVVRIAAAGAPLAAAAVGASGFWRAPTPGLRPLAVLVRDPAHYPVLARIEAELQRLGGESLAMLRVGRAAARPPSHAVAPRLADLFDPGLAMGVIRHRRRVAADLARVRGQWAARVGSWRADELQRIATDELGRIVLGAAGLCSAVRRWRPRLLVALDEIGTWARLLPVVARLFDVPSLDVPHAEAADPVAIRGASYDRWAVYGSRAADVLARAGVPGDRIVAIGAPRFDPLIASLVRRSTTDRPPKHVVFAAQYVTGRMTVAAHRTCYLAALAATQALGPATLTVVRHPAEPSGTAARLVAGEMAPEGVRVRMQGDGGLHAALLDADLLVTGWSNSIFEAAIAGVPSIAVSPGGMAPVHFAADGLSLGARGPDEAAAAAMALRDPGLRREAVMRAREVTERRLGPIDGRASERAAALMLSLARMADA